MSVRCHYCGHRRSGPPCEKCGRIFDKIEDAEPGAILVDKKDPTPEYYRKIIGGIKCDPYRLAKLLGITDHVLFQIFKKVIRAGNKSGNTKRSEVEQIRDAAIRWLEMDDEDTEKTETREVIKGL